jgi:hypothetical protein
MKIKNQPENLIEWIALKANLAPIPLIDTQVAFNAARAIMAAAELGVYEAIGKIQKLQTRYRQHATRILKQQDICLMLLWHRLFTMEQWKLYIKTKIS